LLKQTSADFKLELALMDQKNEVEMLKLESKTHKAELKSRKLQLYFTLGLSILLILILTILLINYRNKTSLNQSLLEKNFEIQKRGVQLESALHEKNLMLKEMHHRVKNNLQLVQSLLRLQAAEVKDPIVSLAFSESINRLSSMSLIHQNLYQQEKFKFIEFKSYLQSLVDHLQDSFHNSHENVTVKVDAEELDISIDNAIPSGLILNELISNAFQHAFKNTKEGKIKVSISKTKNLVSFQVHDNGDGLSDDFSLENDSFGTTLIKMLVQQIQGKIEFANKTGAFFKVTFEDKVN
jgi:two-component sensor histidine kinase